MQAKKKEIKSCKQNKHIQETVSYAMPGPKFNSLSNLN